MHITIAIFWFNIEVPDNFLILRWEWQKMFLKIVYGFEDILLVVMPLGFLKMVRLDNGTSHVCQVHFSSHHANYYTSWKYVR